MNISDVSPKTLRIADALKLNDLLKRAYFNNALVKHTRLKEMNSNLDILTAPFSGTDIILLIGPTGVGVTAGLKTSQNHRFKSGHQRNRAYEVISHFHRKALHCL
jgi:flagellar biosynthesis GTPase FlhF